MAFDKSYEVKDVAAMYNVEHHLVLQWIKAGMLTAINVGKGSKLPRWRVKQSAIEEFEARRTSRPMPSPKRKRKAVGSDGPYPSR